ncbi:hypothetical protein QFZ81_006978 [Paenibacillus sp. V4I9]|uniref:hypothetical protein n=1 Tax=Paenibacillus sp. V4I9 TaxID=3042308 RepID=UPI00277DE1D4|nr:hypothetical protein [Paenibacillus sp. V4I9]MDQ0891890.1 hypothetical protein [Paenibacillus sp. V4I9]
MNHYNEHVWKQYVEERLSPDTLSEMELHLYQCDECLSMYMTCLEQMEAILPIMERDTQGYVDAIIARTTGTKRSWYHSTMLHYGIAAAATLILVATGFFHGISQELDSVGSFKPSNSINTSSSLQTDKPISDQLLNKTLTWLDTLQNK